MCNVINTASRFIFFFVHVGAFQKVSMPFSQRVLLLKILPPALLEVPVKLDTFL